MGGGEVGGGSGGSGGEVGWGGGVEGINLANLLLIAARLSTTAKNIPKSIQIPLKTVSEEMSNGDAATNLR